MLRDTSEVDDLILRDVKRYVTSPRYLYMAYFCIYVIYIANLAIMLHRLVRQVAFPECSCSSSRRYCSSMNIVTENINKSAIFEIISIVFMSECLFLK